MPQCLTVLPMSDPALSKSGVGRLVDHEHAGVVGYAQPLVVAPGATVGVCVSSAIPTGTATLVRLGHDGESWTQKELGGPREVVIQHERLNHGSWGEITAVPVGAAVSTWIRITRWPDTDATIISQGKLRLAVQSDGRLRSGPALSEPLDLYRWYLVAGGANWCAVWAKPSPVGDPEVLIRTAVRRDKSPNKSGTAEQSRQADVILAKGFDGRLARPAIHDHLLPEDVVVRAAYPDDETLVRWDLSQGIDTQDVEGRYPGRFHQGPTRAVPGPDWDGSTLDWRHAPQHYDAVHFHSDDLIEAGWNPVDHIDIPADTPSGIYAVRVQAKKSVDMIPFFVEPRARTKDVAVLLPTLTYLAYANEQAQPPLPEQAVEIAAPFGRSNRLLSWYDRHSDNSRVVFASTRRPLMGVRPDHRFRYLGAPHGLSADLALLGWMDRRGIDHDVITDHQLDLEGKLNCKVLVTGGHPEYWTERMLDALDEFLADGGRLVYLGGNGFLWSVALDPERPWLAEMRRGQIENVPIDGEAGEDHFQLTGRPSGLWRAVGRPEAPRVGVATTAMGFGDGVPYTLTAARADQRVKRLFDGVDARPGDAIGGFGPKGGVVGYETDLANAFLGTPSHALVVATAKLPESYGAFAPNMFPGPTGETIETRRRGDMVFFETGSGGAVLSASSILWNLSLSHNGDNNEISRITENAIRWFSDDHLQI